MPVRVLDGEIKTGKYAGKALQLPTQDSYNLNWESWEYGWRHNSGKLGFARWSDEENSGAAEKILELLKNSDENKKGIVLAIEQAKGPFHLDDKYDEDDQLIAYYAPEIKRNGNEISLNYSIVTARAKVLANFDQSKYQYNERTAKAYRLVSRNAESKLKIKLISYDIKTDTPNIPAPLPFASLCLMLKMEQDCSFGGRMSQSNRSLMCAFLALIRRVRFGDDDYSHKLAFYNNDDGSSNYRKTNTRPLTVWDKAYPHSEWMRWESPDGAWWYSLPPKREDLNWTQFRISEDQFFSGLKICNKFNNSIMIKPMLVVPNLSPRAITTGKDIADFTENKLNSIRAGLRHYSAMVGYTLVSQLDAAGYTEQYDKDRIEQTLKRRVYHMPMGVFDYSISTRVPVMVLKAPIDFANELSQNVLPSIIQSALAAGEKPDMYNIVNYGFKQMMREGTYGHSDESTSGLERLHGFYTESRAFDNDKRLMNPLHPVEKKSVRELNKYEMKQILSVIGLPATRENRFW